MSVYQVIRKLANAKNEDDEALVARQDELLAENNRVDRVILERKLRTAEDFPETPAMAQARAEQVRVGKELVIVVLQRAALNMKLSAEIQAVVHFYEYGG